MTVFWEESFLLTTRMIKIHYSHISPLLLSGWSITPELCNITHVPLHTYTQAEIIMMAMVMQEIKEQPAYYSMAAGRQAVTARRERLLEHTHTLSPIHTCSHSEGKICLPASLCWETYYCCNLFVYKTHLDEWLQKKERLWVTATVFNCMSHSLVL